ncbi:MAG: hypothetical protein IJ882_04620, partial [Paludibacteraceae bacterium]|nr:hypothetical protein [Paludibacteraceae bacterium]
AQLGERTVRIREVRGFDPLQVHHRKSFEMLSFQGFFFSMYHVFFLIVLIEENYFPLSLLCRTQKPFRSSGCSV